jgi:hypothetical protein
MGASVAVLVIAAVLAVMQTPAKTN